jgi:hypothetical protein
MLQGGLCIDYRDRESSRSIPLAHLRPGGGTHHYLGNASDIIRARRHVRLRNDRFSEAVWREVSGPEQSVSQLLRTMSLTVVSRWPIACLIVGEYQRVGKFAISLSSRFQDRRDGAPQCLNTSGSTGRWVRRCALYREARRDSSARVERSARSCRRGQRVARSWAHLLRRVA